MNDSLETLKADRRTLYQQIEEMKGKKGKDDAKNQAPKGKARKRVRPGAKALDWDEDNPDYPDDDYGYDDYPPEDQDEDQRAK